MKKLTKLIAGITAAVLTLGIAGCEKGTYPDFVNPENPGQIVQTNEKYVINVLSAGGLKLNNVKVSAVNANGQKVKSGISKDGKIELNAALGEYTLEVDESTLPAGYYLDGSTYKTNPEKREEVTISIPSRVIEQTATGTTQYAVGDVVHDFTLTDYRASIEDGYKDKQYKISELLKTNKAVVLNFWYPDCVNCTAEFPALQRAYAASRGVEVLGICTPSYVDKDIANYKNQHANDFNLTFPMGIDRSGIATKFGVNAWPVTVVIDRYGLVAYREEGAQPNFSAWKSLFDNFTADDYKQNLISGGTPGGTPGTTSPDREKPNVDMPASSVMEKAANGIGFEAHYSADTKDEYAWPWTNGTDADGNTYIMTTNKGKSNSYSTVYVNFSLKQGDMLCFDYRVSSEKNSDFLYVLLDNVLINGEGWSGETGWVSKSVYVADRQKNCELTFIFQKDSGDPDDGTIGEDVAMIRNLHVETVSDESAPLDIMRECVSGEFNEGEGRYSYYVTPVMGDDGFYHKGSKDGPIIYMTINNITPWSAVHTTDNHFEADGTSLFATLYYMSFYKYSKTVENGDGGIESFTVNMGGKDYSAPLVAYHHMLDMLEAPYYLMPVTKQLYDWANAFITEYAYEQGTATHENEWLEFCYYYDHYGSLHPDGKCKQFNDETKGLTIYNCDEVFEKDDARLSTSPAYNEKSGKNTATIKYPLANPNGVYYKFTPKETGVYQIRDYSARAADSPTLAVYTLAQDGLNTHLVEYSENVRDHDQYAGVSYENFNCYLELSAGETVYLFFRVSEQIKSTLDFEISYLGKTYEKMLLASTGDGAWTYDKNFQFIYLGIPVKYDSTTDAFYKENADGSADLSKPVYIDMFSDSFFISNDSDHNYDPLYYFIENNYFAQMYQGSTIQNKMRAYLEQAKASPDKLIKADKYIVEYINMLIDEYVDGGRGDGRGWLAFACYMERWGD